jgi:hypothetical protein
MPRKKRSLTTRYYHCEGSPARIHEDELRDLTADIYRSGKGIVAVDPTYVYYNSFPISRERYNDLVREIGESFEAPTPPVSK